MQIDFHFSLLYAQLLLLQRRRRSRRLLKLMQWTEYLHMNLSCLQRTTAKEHRGAGQPGCGKNETSERTFKRTFVSRSCAASCHTKRRRVDCALSPALSPSLFCSLFDSDQSIAAKT